MQNSSWYNPWQTYPWDRACPTCGYCPTCGRKNSGYQITWGAAPGPQPSITLGQADGNDGAASGSDENA